MAQESYHFAILVLRGIRGTYGIKDKKQQMPTPKSIYTNSTRHTLPLRKGAPVPCKYTIWVDVHLQFPSEYHYSKVPNFRRIRRKRYERLSLKIGQALDSRQRLITGNPRNDNCKSNEKVFSWANI